ncbi:MAG: DUF4340 domain-containing protein [Candidatus Sumerlaeota bacterium]|nr:DUF4340 domain-containing protein [Candidatus Sumerlaeota bacterium]
MNFKGTLIALVLFLVVLGAFYFDYSRKQKKETAKSASEQLLQMDAKTIDHLTIKNPQGEFELAKAGKDEEGWKVLKPIETQADDSTMKSLIASLAGARKKNPFALGQRSLADYGLEKPAIAAELKASSKGEIADLSVGDEGAEYGQNYARLAAKPDEVFLVPSSVKTALDKKLYDLRDKTILRCPPDDITTVTLTTAQGEFEAEKHDKAWTITRPVKDAGESTAISDFLRKINEGKAASFVDTTGTLNLAVYGLDAPKTRLAVWGPKTEGVRTLLVGDQQPEQDKYYGKVEGAEQVFAIPSDIYKELEKDAKTFRSKEVFPDLTSSFDVNAMKVESKKKGAFEVNKDKEGKWTLVDEPDKNLDKTKVEDLAAALCDLRIKDVLTDDPKTSETLKYGFETPELQVTLQNTDKGLKDSVEIGLFEQDNRVIYARSVGQTSLFTLEWSAPEKLEIGIDDLVERKLATFKTDEVSTIDAQKRLAGGKVDSYHFEKAGAAKEEKAEWKGKKNEEALQSVPTIEVDSFLNTLTGLSYKTRYEAGSQDPEIKLAPFKDLETTMTLKGAEGKPLLDVGMTIEQFDQRFARQPDGVAWSIKAEDYKPVASALDRLLGTIKVEEKAQATKKPTPKSPTSKP